MSELDDPLERRDVSVHREHAVGHDQRAATAGLAQTPLEMVGVAVGVDERPRSREPTTVNYRRVVERIGEDDIPLTRERGDDPGVCQVAGSEEQARLGALE